LAPITDSTAIPLHNLHAGGETSLFIRAISHSNQYDFTRRHRHSYYEILFFEKGGGRQLIDFQDMEVQDHACYLVHPNQIHLLNRHPDSRGRLIQFRAGAVISAQVLTRLRGRIWDGVGAAVYENDPTRSAAFALLLDQLLQGPVDPEHHSERNLHLLQVLLFDLLDVQQETQGVRPSDSDLNRFLQLVDAHFKEQHSVQFYLSRLDVSEKRLGGLTRQHLGVSPLQAIHQRLLLEIRRSLLFAEDSHKEMAYALGFDSPSSFSAFVKKKTGMAPSELQAAVGGIQKG
jgi:AraC family transcriptional activator of pobA